MGDPCQGSEDHTADYEQGYPGREGRLGSGSGGSVQAGECGPCPDGGRLEGGPDPLGPVVAPALHFGLFEGLRPQVVLQAPGEHEVEVAEDRIMLAGRQVL